MKKDNQLIVIKTNALIQDFQYDLSEAEWDVFDYIIAQIKNPFALTEEEKKEIEEKKKIKLPEYDKEFNEISFNAKDYYKEVYGLTTIGGTQYKQLVNAIDSLSEKKTSPIILTSGKYEGYETRLNLINKRYVNHETGHIIIKLDDDLKPYLLELKRKDGKYTQYGYKYKVRLSSKYSRRLYELLKSNQGLKDGIYPPGVDGLSVEEFKILLNIPEKYRFNNIKERILETCIEDINDNTDIHVDYKLRKGKGKKITGISFKISAQSDPLKRIIDVDYIETLENDDSFEQLVEYLGSAITSELEEVKQLIVEYFVSLLKDNVSKRELDSKIKEYINQKIRIIDVLNLDENIKLSTLKKLVLSDIELVSNSNKNETVKKTNTEVKIYSDVERNLIAILKTTNDDEISKILNLVDTYILERHGKENSDSFKELYIERLINYINTYKNPIKNVVSLLNTIIQSDIDKLYSTKFTEKNKKEKPLPKWYTEQQKNEEESKDDDFDEAKRQELLKKINSKNGGFDKHKVNMAEIYLAKQKEREELSKSLDVDKDDVLKQLDDLMSDIDTI